MRSGEGTGSRPPEDTSQQRLEELRQAVQSQSAVQRDYAVQTLLALAWVESGPARVSTLQVLSGHSLLGEETSLFATRVAARLQRTESPEDLPTPLPPAELSRWMGQATTLTLTEGLDILKAALRTLSSTDSPLLRREAALCFDALTVIRLLRAEVAVEACLRTLRLFPPDRARTSGVLARHTTLLREAAATAIAAFSPDSLFPLWSALGGPDTGVRHDLLPVLDYLQDARALPYLARLLARSNQWPDGELAGWFVVRAFEHIGDRRALPPLRQLEARLTLQVSPHTSFGEAGTTLIQEVRRVLQSLEKGYARRESRSLLRPAAPYPRELLRSALDPSPERDFADQEELLRPEALPTEYPRYEE